MDPEATEATNSLSRLSEVEGRLKPGQARAWAIAELNELFALGTAPDPAPDGLLRGRPITSTIATGFDALGRRLASAYMPWLGKRFDAAAGEGVNTLAPSAARPLKLLWPSYTPVQVFADRIDAFPFRTRIDLGAVDPAVQVLKIDYDFDDNPSFIIRRVLDELVQIEEGHYLGKVLYRFKGELRPIGFFVLER